MKLSCYCSGWQGDALRSSETSATCPFPVSYVILGKVIHKSYIVHGTARDTWLPSTSHWAFCESVQRPRQAARSRTTYEAVTTATKTSQTMTHGLKVDPSSIFYAIGMRMRHTILPSTSSRLVTRCQKMSQDVTGHSVFCLHSFTPL